MLWHSERRSINALDPHNINSRTLEDTMREGLAAPPLLITHFAGMHIKCCVGTRSTALGQRAGVEYEDGAEYLHDQVSTPPEGDVLVRSTLLVTYLCKRIQR